MIEDIFSIQVWDVGERTSSSGMFQPAHHHYDILYLGTIPEDTPFARQEDEVDDIRWFDIDGIEKYIAEMRMIYMIGKIRSLK
jgi:8-oxo-dGTP pyrophosphatase MutT (NUDIX family)